MVFSNPTTASATTNNWRVDWCNPGPCDPNRTYGQGMPLSQFKATATNPTATCTGANDTAAGGGNIANTKGGWMSPPTGFVSGYDTQIRYIAGEPSWCANTGQIYIPLRYYAFTKDPWVKGTTTSHWNFGSANAGGAQFQMKCIMNNGSTYTSNVMTGTLAATAYSTNAPTITRPSTTGDQSTYLTQFWKSGDIGGPSGSGDMYNRLNLTNATACATLLTITIWVGQGGIAGDMKKLDWTAARALNNSENIWSNLNPEKLDCTRETQPQECAGQNVAPFAAACAQVTIDPSTWRFLGACMIGTPEDYVKGLGSLQDVTEWPLPSSGSCSPVYLMTFMSADVVIDVCGWYPGVRPTIDVLMTAGLWISVVVSVFTIRTGEK